MSKQLKTQVKNGPATLIENQMLASPARVLAMASETISASLDRAAEPVDPTPRQRALEEQHRASTPPGGPRREVSMPLSPTPISFSAIWSVKK